MLKTIFKATMHFIYWWMVNVGVFRFVEYARNDQSLGYMPFVDVLIITFSTTAIFRIADKLKL